METITKEIIDLSQLANGTLLAVGSVNWDFVLCRYDGAKPSMSVRAVPKAGPQYAGCQECGFGSPSYWANVVKGEPEGYELTDAGRAVVAATFQQLRAVGAAW